MKDQQIVIVDYGMGNLYSVQKKLKQFSQNVVISSNRDEILAAEKLILPGVGHFGKAMENLKNLDLINPLNEAVIVNKTPILGICLGLQIMTRHSEEGNVAGLGWFDATVVKFCVKDQLKYKVPHTGWNQVEVKKNSLLMQGITDSSEFYFVHSYHIEIHDMDLVLNETEYEYRFASALEKENIFGVQYHPEKSHEAGNTLIENFVNSINK